jgi:hypothetical protein
VQESLVGSTQVTVEMDIWLIKKLCCMCQICHQNTFGHLNAAKFRQSFSVCRIPSHSITLTWVPSWLESGTIKDVKYPSQ